MERPELLTIGQVAESCGVSVAAIRHYEHLGLLTASARVGGKRRFDNDILERVDFIRKAQSAGFSLEEIRLLLTDDGNWRSLVAARLSELYEHIDQMNAVVKILERAQACRCVSISQCRNHGPINAPSAPAISESLGFEASRQPVQLLTSRPPLRSNSRE